MKATAPRLAALAAVVLRGISFVATRAALREIPPVTLVFTRFALLFVLLALRGWLSLPPRGAWPALAGMGFLGVFLHQMLQAHALRLTTAVLLLGEPVHWTMVVGGIVLLGGVAVVQSARNSRRFSALEPKWQVET